MVLHITGAFKGVKYKDTPAALSIIQTLLILQ